MSRRRTPPEPPAWSGLAGLDKLLEHRTRLGICVLLARHDTLTFSRLKELLEETDGALGAHLRKLEDDRYVTVRKKFQDRKPITWYALTAAGRGALEGHVKTLEKLIKHGA